MDITKKIWKIQKSTKNAQQGPPKRIFEFYHLFSHPEPQKTWKPQHPERFSKRTAAPARPRVAKAMLSNHHHTARHRRNGLMPWCRRPLFKGGGRKAHPSCIRLDHPEIWVCDCRKKQHQRGCERPNALTTNACGQRAGQCCREAFYGFDAWQSAGLNAQRTDGYGGERHAWTP